MGTLALANMVPIIEPDSQWTAALLSQALVLSFFGNILSKNKKTFLIGLDSF